VGGYDRYVHSCRRLILSTEAECLSRVSVAGLLLKERRDGNYDGAALQVVGEGWGWEEGGGSDQHVYGGVAVLGGMAWVIGRVFEGGKGCVSLGFRPCCGWQMLGVVVELLPPCGHLW